MSQVAVHKLDSNEATSPYIVKDMEDLTERIRRRAFELFKSRGGGDGWALNDWLTAENGLLLTPESDLVESDDKCELQIAVPGFDAKDIDVTALPDALIVSAKNTHNHEKTEGNVRFCEFGEKSLFRRFALPAPIDVDKVTTSLQKGILKVTAPKAEKTAPKNGSTAV
jgi:HSP20 family protein